ncbi:BTB/POZ domain-containing protein 9, variant 2 [Trebouxia sp. C0009 RCD-2024]
MQPVQGHPQYMAQLSAAFANMADVKLLVEGQPLPAHSMILAANSKVFAEMFTKATAQQPDSSQQLEVPLPGDTLKDVSTALDYLYKGCTVWLATTLVIHVPEDAVSLAKFAHKYGVEPLLQACQDHLVKNLKQYIAGADKSVPTGTVMAHLIDVAETCEMRELLAHCELFMIKSNNSNLWTDHAMVSDQMSRHSLLRMLRALQAFRCDVEATKSGSMYYSGSGLLVTSGCLWSLSES